MSDTHQHTLFDHSNPERYRASRRVTFVSLAANFLLSVAQVVIGLLGHSQALVADGMHTLSDLLTDILVLFALYHSQKGADDEHPYGHERIETAVSMILGLLLFGVAVGIAVSAGIKIYTQTEFTIPDKLTLWTALFTLVAKEALYQYTIRVANQYDSNMLRGNAWHHRSDAVSSLVVAVGIAGSLLGVMYLDAIAAVVVAIMVGKIGIELAWVALRELVDTGLKHDQLSMIEKTIIDVPEVKSLHILRSRSMGGHALVDVHVQVAEYVSVSEGHHISESVRQSVISRIDEVTDVMVHIDPEDDEMTAPNASLPLRHQLLPRLRQAWRSIDASAGLKDNDIILHYLDGGIKVDLVLPLQLLENEPRATQARLHEQFSGSVAGIDEVKGISLYFQ